MTALTLTMRTTWKPLAQGHGDASGPDKHQDQACGLACKQLRNLIWPPSAIMPLKPAVGCPVLALYVCLPFIRSDVGNFSFLQALSLRT